MADSRKPIAVLISGGLDSAILLAEMLRTHAPVHPLYVRTGLAWEGVELHHLCHFLKAIDWPTLQPLHVLDMPVADLYGHHWSITGRDVPDADTPEKAVYLPGRNVLLLAKGMLWCHLHDVPQLAMGVLGSNPFPDATDHFFHAYPSVVNEAVEGHVEVVRPFAGKSKRQVMAHGQGLPLELTFSCIRPLAGRHCGLCNKCAERRRAFADAHLADPTDYHPEEGPCTA